MSQSWPTISSASNVSIDDIIARLDALRSSFSGTAAPSPAVLGQLFYDTDTGPGMNVCTNATGPVFAGLATVLDATELLTKIKTVDGTGSGLDADTLNGHDTSYFQVALGYTPLNSTAFTGANVLSLLLAVDGSGSGLDADTLDGHDTSYFQVALGYTPLNSTAYTAADVLSKLLTVDGSGSGLDADLLDGQSSAYFLDIGNMTGTLAAARIASNSLAIGKIAATATNKLFGRFTASAGAGEEIGLGTGFSFSGGNLTLNVATAQGFTSVQQGTGTGQGANAIKIGWLGTLLGLTVDSTDFSSTWPINVTGSAASITTAAITGLTADAAPDMSADYAVTYDTSATALKKVLLQYIGAGKQAFWVAAGSMAPRASNGCAAVATLETTTNKQNYDYLAFDPTTQEFAVFDWRAPKAIDTNTFTFLFVWSHPSTTTNFGVVWGISGAGRSDTDAMEIANGTAVTATDTGGTTDTIYISPVTAACTLGGTFAAEDYLKFQISRNPADASDTMAVDARLHGVWVIVNNNRNTEA